jgi:hypothetical protein
VSQIGVAPLQSEFVAQASATRTAPNDNRNASALANFKRA